VAVSFIDHHYEHQVIRRGEPAATSRWLADPITLLETVMTGQAGAGAIAAPLFELRAVQHRRLVLDGKYRTKARFSALQAWITPTPLFYVYVKNVTSSHDVQTHTISPVF